MTDRDLLKELGYKPVMYKSKLANRWVNMMRRLYKWLGKSHD